MKSKLILKSARNYAQLVEHIRSEIAKGQKIVRQTYSEKNWKIGKAISEYVLNGHDRSQYGEQIYQHLSSAIGIHPKTLRQAVDFYHKFPIWNARSKLTWTHFRELLAMPDQVERRRMMDKAEQEQLTSRQLKEQIRKKKLIIPTEGPIPQLKVTRGKIGTHVIKENKGFPAKDAKCVDCGFSVSFHPAKKALAYFDIGQIVETSAEDLAFSIHASQRTASDLYTFKASVEKIIDGDTLKTCVELRFEIVKIHTLRLRGIDTPEISTPLGQKARKFVEDRIKQCFFIVIRSHKDDKYGRYLADVFYLPGEKDPAKVAADGIYLNQELLDNRLAVKWR